MTCNCMRRRWQMYFGIGLVATPEDFGSQGANPTHPKLLDWLASDFIHSGWNVKRMQKQIVMSATYRQSSRVTDDLLKKDAANQFLGRGPRFRLYGQALRDQALAVSGMLSEQAGGPPVMPYQPAGLWDEVSERLVQPATGLSGGQQQRLCIARAIAVAPKVILMDEPCSALDPIATARIEELIDELRQKFTIIIVTHSMQQAARVSQRTAFFHMGILVEHGDTGQIFTTPQDERTESYITGRIG